MIKQKINKLKPLKNLFWSVNYRDLNLEEDKHFIIHQVLALGSWQQIKYLFSLYGFKEIRKEFLKPSLGLYDPGVLKLCAYLLDVKKLDKRKYIKNIYEPVL